MKNTIKTWIPVFAGMAMIIATLNQLVFAETHAYPVPFVAKKHTGITFTDLPGAGSIKVFTIDGEEVADLVIAPGEILKQWNVTSSNGKKLASGVYLYRIEGNGAKTEGKLVIVR